MPAQGAAITVITAVRQPAASHAAAVDATQQQAFLSVEGRATGAAAAGRTGTVACAMPHGGGLQRSS